MWRSTIVTTLLAVGLTNAQGGPAGYPEIQAAFPNTTYPNATDFPFVPSNLFGATSPPFYPSPWMDGSGGWAAAMQQAQAFVSQLTLLEKVNLTTGVGWAEERCVGNTGSIPRLGFRALCMQDSPLGIRFGDYVSAFPAGGTVAASWDRNVWYQRGFDMGSEHRGKGVDAQLGPVVGPIGRHPEGGRNWEGFSPDPVLSGHAVAETIRGMQAAGIMATTKHLIGNEQEHFRTGGGNLTGAISANIDDTTMHELYLWPFADAVRAGTASVMCSYQQLNNSQTCQNSYLLNYLLKGELGFQGFVMSDWSAQHSGVGSALAGLDMSMPGDIAFDTGTSYWGSNLTIAVLNGTIPEWRLDDMVTRIVAAWYYVDRASNQVPVNMDSWSLDTYGYLHSAVNEGYQLINEHVDVRGNHGADIRDQAARSTVLLKNSGVLPLTGREKQTAVFGEDASINAWGPNGCPDRGCDNGTLAMGWGSGTTNFPYLVTPLEAIKNEVIGQNHAIQSVTDNAAYTQISSVARQVAEVNGVCLVFVNADAGEGYISVDGNSGDRNNLTLWRDGDALILRVASECNNTVVVMHTVGPVLLNAFVNNPNVTGILWAGLPGEQSGNSIADVLYGRTNPGGKLPFTLGSSREDYGSDVLYQQNNGVGPPQDNFDEGVFIDYRAFDRANIQPIYEFGYGLSYTTFSYSNLNIITHCVGAYTPTTGTTSAAPTLGNFSTNPSDYVFPAHITRASLYIYPYLTSSDLAAAYNYSDYNEATSYVPTGATTSAPQERIAAGGAPGGNPQLYDVLFTVTATVTNTGNVDGDEVAQLYLNLGGPNQPKVVLRGFERMSVPAGQSLTFTTQVTRRDISNWDTVSQNWVISTYPKTAYVGSSSRNLPLTAALPAPNFGCGSGGSGSGGSSASAGGNGGSSSIGSSGGNGGSSSTGSAGGSSSSAGGYGASTSAGSTGSSSSSAGGNGGSTSTSSTGGSSSTGSGGSTSTGVAGSSTSTGNAGGSSGSAGGGSSGTGSSSTGSSASSSSGSGVGATGTTSSGASSSAVGGTPASSGASSSPSYGGYGSGTVYSMSTITTVTTSCSTTMSK